MTIIQAIILAIVEGLTEFLPVSSTGHMIIASALMGISHNEFTKVFEVNIQFGAILSVVVLYWRRFFNTFDFYVKLFVAFIPMVILGFIFKDKIDEMLESVVVVAISLLVGGIFLVFIDKIFKDAVEDTKTYTFRQAIVIGFFQCIAMIPGVSRSAASIIGGQTQGLSRKSAAEFSFFLAVPTMLAASGYKLVTDFLGLEVSDILKFRFDKIQTSISAIPNEHLTLLLIGNIVAFVVAMLAIKFFIGFLTKYGFKIFGYYRIVLGLTLLILLALGVDLQII